MHHRRAFFVKHLFRFSNFPGVLRGRESLRPILTRRKEALRFPIPAAASTARAEAWGPRGAELPGPTEILARGGEPLAVVPELVGGTRP